MLTAEQEESILKHIASLSNEFKDALSESDWIKERVDRHKIISDLLSPKNIDKLTEADFRKIIKSLWAFNGWTNKDWVIDNILKANGLDKIKKSLKSLFYGSKSLTERYDDFKIKNLGTSSITELMAFVDPNNYCLWNDKPRKVFPLFGITQIPNRVYKYSQITGEEYVKCNSVMKDILKILSEQGFKKINLLDLDLFIWTVFNKIEKTKKQPKKETKQIIPDLSSKLRFNSETMTHWDAIGLLVELGNALGFNTYVADPSRKYREKLLGDIATSKEIPEQTKMIRGIERTDVIWSKFEPPIYLFEVEDGGTMREALHRLYQARYFESKFFVVCPLENRKKFEKYIITDPFKGIRKKYLFRSYDELIALHHTVMNYARAKTEFFEE